MQSNYTLEEITNLQDLAESLSKYHPTQPVEESLEILEKHFVFGYKGYNDVSTGFVYALNVDNAYLIDGCNDGIELFFAVNAAKKVRDILFRRYTDQIFCVYPTSDTHSHILCKRIGFKRLCIDNDKTIFFLKRS